MKRLLFLALILGLGGCTIKAPMNQNWRNYPYDTNAGSMYYSAGYYPAQQATPTTPPVFQYHPTIKSN